MGPLLSFWGRPSYSGRQGGSDHGAGPARREEGEEDALGAIEGALEWADENWRIIFGLTVIIVLSCVLFPSLLAFGGTTVPSPRPPTGGAPAAAASESERGERDPEKPARYIMPQFIISIMLPPPMVHRRAFKF